MTHYELDTATTEVLKEGENCIVGTSKTPGEAVTSTPLSPQNGNK